MAGFVEVRAPSEDGFAEGRLFVPPGDGPCPVVVQYMDAGGLRPAMDALAEPLLERGWAVLQPNLYRRSGPFAPFDFATVWTDPVERARIGALMNGFTPEQAMADTRALLGALPPRCTTRRIAALGYCMGGRMAFYAASAFGEQLVAAASVHGGGLVTPAPNSPHLRAADIRGSVYFAVADQDRSCTPADCEALGAALRAAGVRHEIELFPGKLHGFAMRDFPVYDAGAAAHQWARILPRFAEAFAAA